MRLFHLANNILGLKVLSVMCNAKDLAKLDTAMTNCDMRPFLISLFQTHCLLDGNFATNRKKNLHLFYIWINVKRLLCIKLHVDKSFFSKATHWDIRLQRITHLKLSVLKKQKEMIYALTRSCVSLTSLEMINVWPRTRGEKYEIELPPETLARLETFTMHKFVLLTSLELCINLIHCELNHAHSDEVDGWRIMSVVISNANRLTHMSIENADMSATYHQSNENGRFSFMCVLGQATCVNEFLQNVPVVIDGSIELLSAVSINFKTLNIIAARHPNIYAWNTWAARIICCSCGSNSVCSTRHIHAPVTSSTRNALTSVGHTLLSAIPSATGIKFHHDGV